jgi:hypothetical protein
MRRLVLPFSFSRCSLRGRFRFSVGRNEASLQGVVGSVCVNDLELPTRRKGETREGS